MVQYSRKSNKILNLLFSSAPDALSFEHFLPWIWKIMLAYQEPDKKCSEEMLPQGTGFSKGYFSKKVN
jgi:hypothetical protein